MKVRNRNLRKENMTYYFSVEGGTEKWYLDWLKDRINESAEAKYTVKLDSKIQKDPRSRVKGMTIINKTEITHIFDRESEESSDYKLFIATLDRMKEAEQSGKSIKYTLGYSNFTFDLWMILHKADCNSAKCHRKDYLEIINQVYHERFETLEDYKREKNFERILKQLSLKNVREAIRRAERLMQRNQEMGLVLQQYKGYSFYNENPSLSIWEIIKKILKDCKLL